MNETGAGMQGGESAAPTVPEADGRSGPGQPFLWLLRQKIAVPGRVAGYFDRAQLVERAMPTRRRLTVLMAPGGFGKSTLLAECCRRIRDEGIPVAWVSVDEQDERAILDTYVAYACQSAAAGGFAEVETPPMSILGETDRRIEIAMREIEDREGPFVLVFDELERLRSAGAAALLDFVLQRGPPNLHLAFACRELPAGLNIAGAALDGRAAVLSVDDLRFSRSEVADFFERKLSRRELAALMSESAGWPFALRISRNEMGNDGRGDPRASREIVENWVETRLFAGLGEEDREFLLDIGLLEWMDAALLDDVLERSDSMRRIDTMPVLVGLLEPVRDGATDVWRLHPLIREHCVRRRFRETPQRFRTVHRRIADALMRRGQTVDAMRHAVEAGEPALAGDFLESAGGVRLFSREGLGQFRAAERLLSKELVAARPRLALVCCLSLILSGRMAEAKEEYRAMASGLDRLAADAGDSALDLAADNFVVRGMIVLYGGERFGSALMQSHLADAARLAESPRVDPMTRGVMEYSLCIAGGMTANFEAALGHSARARQCFAGNRNMAMFIDIQEGQVAMAQGRVQDASLLYRRAGQTARRRQVLDPEPAAICEALLLELELERGRTPPGEGPARVPDALAGGSTPFQAYAAASGAVAESKRRDDDAESAVAAAEEMLGYVRHARLPALVRHVAALRVSLLAAAGRTGEGEKAWAADGLPEAADDCLDLAGQTWREMEALSCARLRLAIGHRRFREARSFAGKLCGVAAARGMKRTLMRALALSAMLEVRAGDTAAAEGHLEACLRLYVDTPFAWPLIQEREDCTRLVAGFLETAPDSPVREAARSLLAAMVRADGAGHPKLNDREMQVLQRLAEQRDKQIAAELGLTPYGVRYHIRKLFTKLGVRNRAGAVRRAREMGLIPFEP